MVLKAPQHIKAATPVLLGGLVVSGLLAGLCIGGGIAALVWNIMAPTEFNFLGVMLTTGHVGVALTALGVILALFVIRSSYKRVVQLAKIPESRG